MAVYNSGRWSRLQFALAARKEAIELTEDFDLLVPIQSEVVAGVFFEEDRTFILNLHL